MTNIPGHIANNFPATNEVDSERGQKRRYSYDEVLDLIGIGRFHVFLVLICGWANASDAVELVCISLVLPSVQCELQLSSADLGWLTSGMFLGMMIGGYLWGGLGDAVGRRNVLSLALFINGAFGLISAFAQTYWLLLFCRIMSGIGVGGSIPVTWSYFVEFQPNHFRGGMLSMLASFWMIGQLVVTALAWLVIPQNGMAFYIGDLHVTSWRIFLALSTFTALSSALLILLLPKSPKFSLEKGRHDEALATLKRIYTTTKRTKEFPVLQIDLPRKSSHSCSGFRTTQYFPQKLRLLITGIGRQTFELFRPPILTLSIAMIVIYFALSFGYILHTMPITFIGTFCVTALNFGSLFLAGLVSFSLYYGLSLWFPQLFALARQSATEGRICDAIANGLNITVRVVHSSSKQNLSCDLIAPVDSVYRDNFLIAISSLPGNLLTIFFMDKWGRKPFFIVGIALSAVSAFFIWFVSSQLQVLVLSCVFAAFSVVVWNCLDAFSTELFPTHLRATSMGIGLLFARIGGILGNLAFGYLIETHCIVPLLLVSAFLSFGGIMSFVIPNTTKKSIK